VRREEQVSLAEFGDAYRAYMEKTPAFIPKLSGAGLPAPANKK
jgi:protein-S-isoprenylcysteine O-methyltransferase Ste14